MRRKRARPGCARKWGTEWVPGRDAQPWRPGRDSLGVSLPRCQSWSGPSPDGPTWGSPLCSPAPTSPSLTRGIRAHLPRNNRSKVYTNVRKREEVRTGNGCPRLPAVRGSTALSLVRGQTPEPACSQGFPCVAQEGEQGGEQDGQCPASQRLLSSQTPTRWLAQNWPFSSLPPCWMADPGVQPRYTGPSRSLVK